MLKTIINRASLILQHRGGDSLKKIYIAGPDVFAPDWNERKIEIINYCRNADIIPVFPFDDQGKSKEEIVTKNFDRIKNSDGVIANLNPFRGVEPDSGTVVEITYASVKKIPVYAYLDDITSQKNKYGNFDKDGYLIEDFDEPVNIMISGLRKVSIIQGDIFRALGVFATPTPVIIPENFDIKKSTIAISWYNDDDIKHDICCNLFDFFNDWMNDANYCPPNDINVEEYFIFDNTGKPISSGNNVKFETLMSCFC